MANCHSIPGFGQDLTLQDEFGVLAELASPGCLCDTLALAKAPQRFSFA